MMTYNATNRPTLELTKEINWMLSKARFEDSKYTFKGNLPYRMMRKISDFAFNEESPLEWRMGTFYFNAGNGTIVRLKTPDTVGSTFVKLEVFTNWEN
jgi:predicted metal-dependent peptidase